MNHCKNKSKNHISSMERDITRQTIVDVSIIWHTEKFKSLQLGIKKLGIKRFKVLHANQVEVLYQVMTLCKRALNHIANCPLSWLSVSFELSGCGFESRSCHLNLKVKLATLALIIRAIKFYLSPSYIARTSTKIILLWML